MPEVPVLTTRETSLPEATMAFWPPTDRPDEGALAEAIIRILPTRRRRNDDGDRPACGSNTPRSGSRACAMHSAVR